MEVQAESTRLLTVTVAMQFTGESFEDEVELLQKKTQHMRLIKQENI